MRFSKTNTAEFSVIGDLMMLFKFRLTITVVFSAVLAYWIALDTFVFDLGQILVLFLGGFFITAAANTFNQILEKDFDKLMKRTENRPIAAGRLSTTQAILIAGTASVIGLSLLANFNLLTAVFGFLSLIMYAFIYTPLKRISSVAIPVGAIPGAMPVLIGCVAAQGSITDIAIVLFSIQFFWQFPHFWAIGWLGFEDYKKAGFNFIPERNGERDSNLGTYSMFYAFMLFPMIVILYLIGYAGIISLVGMTVLTFGYAVMGYYLHKNDDRKSALKLMFFSFIYLPLCLLLLLADKF